MFVTLFEVQNIFPIMNVHQNLIIEENKIHSECQSLLVIRTTVRCKMPSHLTDVKHRNRRHPDGAVAQGCRTDAGRRRKRRGRSRGVRRWEPQGTEQEYSNETLKL